MRLGICIPVLSLCILGSVYLGACSTSIPPPLSDEEIRHLFDEAQKNMSVDGATGRVPTGREIEESRAFAESPQGRALAKQNACQAKREWQAQAAGPIDLLGLIILPFLLIYESVTDECP
jgi:hypothetical protein